MCEKNSTLSVFLELARRDVTKRLHNPAIVEPVDPGQCGSLDIIYTAPWTVLVNDLGPKLSPEALKVRPVTDDYKDANCSYIGIVESFGAALEGGYIAALNKLRQKIANSGGNAFKIISERPVKMGDWTHYEITAEALRCGSTHSQSHSTSSYEGTW